MRQYLLEYPKAPARPTTSFIYWQEAAFGLKRPSGSVTSPSRKGRTRRSSRQTALLESLLLDRAELRALVPDAPAARASGS